MKSQNGNPSRTAFHLKQSNDNDRFLEYCKFTGKYFRQKSTFSEQKGSILKRCPPIDQHTQEEVVQSPTYRSDLDDSVEKEHRARRKTLKKRNHEEKGKKFTAQAMIKLQFSPYVRSKQMVKTILKHLKPVHGPNASLVQSIEKHRINNLDNLETAMKGFQNEPFQERMSEYAKRGNYQKNTYFYICNSKQRMICQTLDRWGWRQNKCKNSQFFHLKWVYTDISNDYFTLEQGQFFNHFQGNRHLTDKLCLHNLLKQSGCQQYVPMTYNLSSYDERQAFQQSYDRQSIFSLMKKLQRNSNNKNELVRHLFKLESADPKYRQGMSFYSLLSLYCDSIILQRVFDKCRRLSLKTNRVNMRKITDNIKKIMQKGEQFSGTQEQIRKFNLSCRILMTIFHKQWLAYGHNNLWIIKPTGVSRGSGISILQDIKKIYESIQHTSRLVQKYIENPLIFNKQHFSAGKKFDIRQWVVVTRARPLQASIFSHFYVRVCSDKYSLLQFNKTNAHLTNYSQNKMFFQSKQQSIISQDAFAQLVNDQSVFKKLRQKIKTICLSTLQKAEQSLVQKQGCFQLIGFDIMIDNDYNPWLLQVNLSPAFEQRAPWMKQYGSQMAQGLLRLVLPRHMVPQDTERQYKWQELTLDNTFKSLKCRIVEDSNPGYIKSVRKIQLWWRLVRRQP